MGRVIDGVERPAMGEDVEEAARLMVRRQRRGGLDELPVFRDTPGRVEDEAARDDADAGLLDVVGEAHAPAGAAGDQGEGSPRYRIGHRCLEAMVGAPATPRARL